MKRRWAAVVLALSFAGPLAAPLVASAPAGCARCAGAARCCCASERGPGGCRLVRPCGPAWGGEGLAPQILQGALPEDRVAARVPPAPLLGVRADSPIEPADLPPVPPDPPPRTSL